ncbi:uncharacterized protein BX663DRAFT_526953 [Cokeromyces recurvatus]|uniref:uncharacterized protein n=1 Tax=Cokeromyces recurvatus TaxID=90255 RepID=UPI002220151C|nr:uncharacterized protein BX663DRAFT_526953 [Cokeromyces recurvatus]KAI7897808.1 hypothetical protein BX663DRAFT_526953 [Cokeromyces recurvatus]
MHNKHSHYLVVYYYYKLQIKRNKVYWINYIKILKIQKLFDRNNFLLLSEFRLPYYF